MCTNKWVCIPCPSLSFIRLLLSKVTSRGKSGVYKELQSSICSYTCRQFIYRPCLKKPLTTNWPFSLPHPLFPFSAARKTKKSLRKAENKGGERGALTFSLNPSLPRHCKINELLHLTCAVYSLAWYWMNNWIQEYTCGTAYMLSPSAIPYVRDHR